jgi:short-subunit dehydrogenase
MARRVIRGSRIIITGASSGIGRALAIELGARGARLVLGARRQEKLCQLAQELAAAGTQVEHVSGDITEPATRQALLQRAVAGFGGLDVLINNAGVGAIGRFEHAAPQRLRRVMEVNFFALVEMTRAALPVLEQGTKPMVVNIGSIVGRRAVPRNSEYCASKFAVQGFSQSLRAELAPRGIDLLVVSPGTTQTEFFDSVIQQHGEVPWPQQPGVPAAVVARRTVRAICQGRHEIIPNGRARLLDWLNRLSPRLVDALLARYG